MKIGYAIPWEREKMNGIGAAPTDQQVRDLETALNDQFYYLVQGAAFRVAIARKYGLDSDAFKNYNALYTPLVRNWINIEVPYEQANLKQGVKGIIASGDLVFDDFFLSASLPKLTALVKKWNKEPSTGGIGFIPLLIWAVIAIVGFFTAQKITDDLTSTTRDKTALLTATQSTAKDLGLTPAQATALITDTQAQASKDSGSITDTVKWAALGLGVIFLLPKLLEAFNKSKSN